MFNKSNSLGVGKEGVETIIGSSVKIEGNFVCQGGIIIEGEVKGMVSTAGFLEIGEGATVVADISAKEGKVAGEIRGNIKVEGYLELTASAKIIGDIEVGSLQISRGAIIKGKCSVAAENRSSKTAKTTPVNENE